MELEELIEQGALGKRCNISNPGADYGLIRKWKAFLLVVQSNMVIGSWAYKMGAVSQ